MNNTPTAAQFTAAVWFKSSYSAAENECVEIAHTHFWVGVRDSKDHSDLALIVPKEAFVALVDAVRAGII